MTSATSLSVPPWKKRAGAAWTRSTAPTLCVQGGLWCVATKPGTIAPPNCAPTSCCSTKPTSRWPWCRPASTWRARACCPPSTPPPPRIPPFSFPSNSDAAPEPQLPLDESPPPAELWDRYCAARGWSPQVCQVAASDYAPGKTLRYYQLKAINRTVEAMANGQNRALLVMAAGTGKTSTAFQIIWRLWKSDSRKRILFLADSNTLINQAMVNDFRPFKSAMIKLSFDAKGVERADAPGERKWGDRKTAKEVDKSYEIYLASCRIVTGTGEKHNDIYKQFPPDFFALIVVDESPHGSAAEDSVWREILDYFASATQIGFSSTAVDSDYFGAPIYSYSFRQGIKDGYLAPYKIIRVDLERDTLTGHTMANLTDPYGLLIENYASSVLLHKNVPD